jgi:hypothetical protein
MKITYRVIQPTDILLSQIPVQTVEWRDLENQDDPDANDCYFEELNALIPPLISPPGHIEPMEHVSVLFNGGPADMFVSELGTLPMTYRGPLSLNPIATGIYRNAAISQGKLAHELPPIHGTAVLFDQIVWT